MLDNQDEKLYFSKVPSPNSFPNLKSWAFSQDTLETIAKQMMVYGECTIKLKFEELSETIKVEFSK